jgi:hypothetical protein
MKAHRHNDADPINTLYIAEPGDQAHLTRQRVKQRKHRPEMIGARASFDDGGSRSILTDGCHNIENMPNVLHRNAFDQPMLCNRCFGKHVGFTCPDY